MISFPWDFYLKGLIFKQFQMLCVLRLVLVQEFHKISRYASTHTFTEKYKAFSNILIAIASELECFQTCMFGNAQLEMIFLQR